MRRVLYLSRILGLFHTCDPGGEVKPGILGRLLHHVLKGRGASLFGCFSWEPIGQLHDIDRGSDGNMGQMCFGQAPRNASGVIPWCALLANGSQECLHDGDRCL